MGARPNWNKIWSEMRAAEEAAERIERSRRVKAVEDWNFRMGIGANDRDPDPCPSIRLAVVSGYHWLEVFCPGCRMTGYVDLTTLEHLPATKLSSLIPSLSCRANCRGHAPFARLRCLHREKPAMPRRQDAI